ncbi:agmatine deiminase family protein [Sphingomonas sinipercae]|uniref:Agmatine deiminase family protein n=1 Tax=Sphingomonas sinipercae TaxID=2714944 RepID=A0A6G7ZMJ2_9SPHN|nr:agmatine deiminase family protein [Sphingomonas sinipercae]QIL02116.1 agmatine deiminase family protein [Sphingomonas sinipercae]
MSSPPLPEWAEHEAVWIGFPSDPELWLADLKSAEREVAAFAAAVHADGEGEEVRLVCAHEDAAVAARALAPFATVVVEPFGDIWLRDTGPIVRGTGDARRAAGFRFNGWGGKYDLPGDDSIGERLAASESLPFSKAGWILEGGAIDHDGAGNVITTEQCLLNPNRNTLTRDEVEQRLREDLGFDRVIWLGAGLLNDHTDGHVDNLARFVAPGRIAIPTAAEADPNAQVYADAARRLADAGLDVTTLPSPGRIENDEGDVIPASYMNFYIGNAAVVVPQYGAANDQAAVAAIQALFPDRVAIGLRADHVLTGGGSFHCISQQVPA